MKKLLQTATAALVCASLIGGVAAADSINNTGPSSGNSISTSQNSDSKSDCTNKVDLSTSNLQDANSGNANTSGNITSGGATSGNASNNNSTTINVNESCGSLTTSTTTPSTPSGGKGAGAPAASNATTSGNAVTVAGALPETGSNLAAVVAAGSVIVLGVALSASRLGLATYRRLSL